jgi:hypothetical protein
LREKFYLEASKSELKLFWPFRGSSTFGGRYSAKGVGVKNCAIQKFEVMTLTQLEFLYNESDRILNYSLNAY